MGYELMVDNDFDNSLMLASECGFCDLDRLFFGDKDSEKKYPALYLFLMDAESYDLENLKLDVKKFSDNISDASIKAILKNLLHGIEAAKRSVAIIDWEGNDLPWRGLPLEYKHENKGYIHGGIA